MMWESTGVNVACGTDGMANFFKKTTKNAKKHKRAWCDPTLKLFNSKILTKIPYFKVSYRIITTVSWYTTKRLYHGSPIWNTGECLKVIRKSEMCEKMNFLKIVNKIKKNKGENKNWNLFLKKHQNKMKSLTIWGCITSKDKYIFTLYGA